MVLHGSAARGNHGQILAGAGAGILATLILALATSDAAPGQCPTTTITAQSNYGPNTLTTTAPRETLSTVSSGGGCSDWGCTSWGIDAFATYDLVAGTMQDYVYAYGVIVGDASVAAHDVFTLIGPSPGPPIVFHAHAHGFVASGCVYGPTGSADASIREGASNIASASAQGFQNCQGGQSYDIGVAITLAPGSTFDLYLTIDAHASGSFFGPAGDGHANLSLSFPDLPAGYYVVSCQGFSSGQVTPTRRTSWGQLKALYR